MKNILLILSLFVFSSCVVHHFLTPPVHVPVNKKKGDSHIGINTNQIQVGYAPFNHFSFFYSQYNGWQANELTKSVFSEIESYNVLYRENSSSIKEVGFSYFKGFNNLLYLEIVSALGKGERFARSNHKGKGNYSFVYSCDISTLYVQPTFSIAPGKILDLSIFSRFSYNNQSNIASTFKQANNSIPYPYDEAIFNNNKFSQLIIEPGIQARLGIKNIKVMGQISNDMAFNYFENHTYNLTNEEIDCPKVYNSPRITMALTIDFNTHNIYRHIQKIINKQATKTGTNQSDL